MSLSNAFGILGAVHAFGLQHFPFTIGFVWRKPVGNGRTAVRIPSSALGPERCILGTWMNGNNLDRRTEGNTDFKKGALVTRGNASRVYLECVCCWTARRKSKRERSSV